MTLILDRTETKIMFEYDELRALLDHVEPFMRQGKSLLDVIKLLADRGDERCKAWRAEFEPTDKLRVCSMCGQQRPLP